MHTLDRSEINLDPDPIIIKVAFIDLVVEKMKTPWKTRIGGIKASSLNLPLTFQLELEAEALP